MWVCVCVCECSNHTNTFSLTFTFAFASRQHQPARVVLPTHFARHSALQDLRALGESEREGGRVGVKSISASEMERCS